MTGTNRIQSSCWQSLNDLFADPREVLFVSDQQYVVDQMHELGLPADHLAEVTEPAECIVLVGADYSSLGPREELHEAFRTSAVLWVPLVSFDPSPAAARYSIERMLESDLMASTKRNASWTQVLRRLDRPLTIETLGDHLTFELTSKTIALGTRDQPRLNRGDFVSIAEYFEVDIDGVAFQGEEFYTADGIFNAAGLCVARHPYLDADSPKMAHGMDLCGRVGRCGGARLTIADGHVTSIIVDGNECLQEFIGSVGQTADRLIEFSFGTNEEIRESLDWTINSQINEGAGGVHMALGDGISGAHIDFVAPYAKASLSA